METKIAYTSLRFFSQLVKDYLNKEKPIEKLYTNFPEIKAFERQIAQKQKHLINRKALTEVLQQQYEGVSKSSKTQNNIAALAKENTFTVTTGHQLNLFTGPLYFIYKIVSTINLTKKLKDTYPQYCFVPVYWMATEDHDFEEINHFRMGESEIRWEHQNRGAMGSVDLEGMKPVFESFARTLIGSKQEKRLKELFKNSYLKHSHLTEAMRYLVNELFGKYGLVILDANHKLLKKEFIPHILRELREQLCHREVTTTNSYLKKYNYKIQVNPRNTNLFYLKQNSREHIQKKEGYFYLNISDKKVNSSDLETEVKKYPERFSPNVLMRTLYQESILPNLAYIGGGSEIAYWLQLKGYFDASKTPFPIVLPRNSVLWLTQKEVIKIENQKVDTSDLFLTSNAFISHYIGKTSNPKIDFIPYEKELRNLYDKIEKLATSIDSTLANSAKAQAQRQINELYKLEKKLLRADKRKRAEEVQRLQNLHSKLFPNGGDLQERFYNFSEFYRSMGDDFFEHLFKSLNPLDFRLALETITKK